MARCRRLGPLARLASASRRQLVFQVQLRFVFGTEVTSGAVIAPGTGRQSPEDEPETNSGCHGGVVWSVLLMFVCYRSYSAMFADGPFQPYCVNCE